MILFVLSVFWRLITAEYDNFYFHTSIICSLDNKDSYSYDIKFYEWDTLPDVDDEVSDWYNGTITQLGITNATYFGKDDGDLIDRYWSQLQAKQYAEVDYVYELYAYIRHDCLLYGEPEYVQINFFPDGCKVGKGDCHIYVTLDLTGLVNKGKYHLEHREVIIKQG